MQAQAATEAQLEGFLGRYSDEVQREFRLARKKLRKLFPRGHEMVYDNYNALVVGYSPTERASQAVVSIAGYPRWVTVFFLKGAKLADPAKRLAGSGSTVRSVRLASAKTLDEPEVRDLLQRAIDPYAVDFAMAPKLQTVVRAIATKQRARKPTCKP